MARVDESPEVSFERFTIEKLQARATVGFSPSLQHDMRLEAQRDLVMDELRWDLTTSVYAHKLASYRVTFTAPANWFQHLKMQLGLGYKRTERCHSITRYRTYPNASIVLPESLFGQGTYIVDIKGEA